MRLKKEFVNHDLGQTRFLVCMDPKVFRGFMRGNDTAGFILDRLSEDITEEELIQAMTEEYDADRDVIAKDVNGFLDRLRSMNALEENSSEAKDGASLKEEK